MGTKHVKFSDQPDDVDAGQDEVFPVEEEDFKVTADCIVNSAALINIQGEMTTVSPVLPIMEENYFQVRIPDDIPSGYYNFKISVTSASDPTNSAVIETSSTFEIRGSGEHLNPPEIVSVRFRNHVTTIPSADLTSDTLVINGNNLEYVTSIKITAPTVIFNITSHSQRVMTAKAISAPRVQGLKLVYPEFEYTVTNKDGDFVSSGVVRSNTPLRIQGD